MKILFGLLHYGYVRNFESVVRELAARGHHVHLAAERPDRHEAPALRMIEALAREYPNVTFGALPEREDGHWKWLLAKIRLAFDYLRYLEPAYRGMPGLRLRSEERVPIILLKLLTIPGMNCAAGRRLIRAALRQLENAAPRSAAIEAYLQATRPDAVLITPLIGVVASSQLDYVSSARRLGVPTGFCVWSWDNLSSKALIRDWPDAVFVWNHTQKDEAVTLHGVPPSRVVVTGAQCFDQWFGRAPSRSRAEFCARVGLPVDRPYVLYVCSTMVWRSPSEAEFVVRWVHHLRECADPRLRHAPILVRPHPGRQREWEAVDLMDLQCFDGIAVLHGTQPIEPAARADYFDALYHSVAVAGINTSAFIEAAIVGRPVYTVLAPEFAGTQAGTIHFGYLTRIGGGIAHVARDFDEHAAQLGEALDGRSGHQERTRRFVEAFVRPHGLGLAATPLFADAAEALGRSRAHVDASVSRAIVPGWAIQWLVRVTATGTGRRLLLTRGQFERSRPRRGSIRSDRISHLEQ